MQEQNVRVSGAVTYWSIGPETDYSLLKAGLEQVGLGTFAPEPRTPVAALRAAIVQVFGGSGVLIRPLAKSKTEETGVCVLKEEKGEEVNNYTPVVSAKIENEQPALTAYEELPEEKQNFLRATYLYQQSILGPAQVATALKAILVHLDSTTLRPNGAIYWVPEVNLATWQKVIQVVERASAGETPHSVYLLRTVFDEDAVRAVKDSLVREITERAQEIKEAAEKPNLRESTYTARQKDAPRLHDRIQVAEGILGETLETLHQLATSTEASVLLLASNSYPDTFQQAKTN